MEDNKIAILLVSTVGSFLTPFMGSSIIIALPAVAKEFLLDAVLLGWIPTSYRLAAAIFLVPFGRLADMYGRKRLFAYGIIIFTCSSLFAGLSNTALLLMIALIFQGIGASMIFGTGVAMLTSVYPVGERGKALGINVASVYTGLSLGPFLGGVLTQNFGWRSIFLVSVPLGLIVIGLVFWNVKGEWAEAKGEKFDLVGSLIYGLTLVLIMYGFSQIPDMNGVLLLFGGVLGVIIFITWELRVINPVLNLKLFQKSRMFTFSNLAVLLNYSAAAAVGFLLSLYLQFIKGLDPQNAGIVLIAQPIFQAVFSPVSGWISDRIEPQRVVSLGMALIVIGLSLFTRLSNSTSINFIIIGQIFLGLGFAIFSSPNTNAIMSSVEKKFYGMASGTIGTMRLIGQMLSVGIATMLFTLFIGRVQITPELYPEFLRSVQVAFGVFALLCFGGILASLARGKIQDPLHI